MFLQILTITNAHQYKTTFKKFAWSRAMLLIDENELFFCINPICSFLKDQENLPCPQIQGSCSMAIQ